MYHKFSEFYLSYLVQHFSGLNLTRITNPDEFYEKQVLDSVYPFENYKNLSELVSKTGLFVDVGFGGGFPILPLRELIDDDVKFFGIDSRKKKVDAVNSISKSYNQKNIYFIHNRLESVYFNEPAFVTFKAVGDVSKMLKLFKGVRGSYILFYKAKNFESLEPNFKVNNGFKFIEMKKYNIGENERSYVLFEKINNCPKNKSLVNLSEFVFNN